MPPICPGIGARSLLWRHFVPGRRRATSRGRLAEAVPPPLDQTGSPERLRRRATSLLALRDGRAGLASRRWPTESYFSLGSHVEADSFFDFVHGGYLEPWLPESHPQNVIVMQAVASAAAAYADGGYTTVVEGIISPNWFLAPMSQALAARGHAVSYAILRPKLATCIARAAARPGGELSNADVITQLWNDFADIDGLERHVIEVDDLEPEPVARTVTSRWRAADLRI